MEIDTPRSTTNNDHSWPMACLGEVAHFRSGHRNSETATADGKFPFFVCSREVLRSDEFDFDDEAVIMAGNNADGVFHLHHFCGKFAARQRTYVITPRTDRLSCSWLFHQLGRLQPTFQAAAIGTTTRYVTIGMLRNAVIPVPSIAIQHAVANALSDVDRLLGGLDRLIAKKRDLKQAAMQQLLTGQTRLPGISGEWKVRRLREVTDADPENLGSDTPGDFAFNYISLEDVDRGRLKSFSEQIFRTAPSRARRKLRRDDILVSTVRPNLKSHLRFTEDDARWACSTGFCVLRCRKNISHPAYIFYHMFGHPVARQIDALLTGSNYPAINSADVRALDIPLPNFAEQIAIAEVLSEMDAELAALEQRREKTRALKQAMMQELLSGKQPLVQAEAAHA